MDCGRSHYLDGLLAGALVLSFTATCSAGPPCAAGEGGSEGGSYVAARFGHGFLAERPGDKLVLPAEGNLRPDRGSLEMWVQVPRGSAAAYEWRPLFVAQEKPYQPTRGIILQLIRNGSALAFLAGPLTSGVSAEIDWKQGETHCLAGTWGPRGVALYIDGERVGHNPNGPDVRELPPRMSLGGYVWEVARNPAVMVIDEVRISAVQKTDEEIRSTCRSEQPFGEEPDTLVLLHLDPGEAPAGKGARAGSGGRTEAPSPRPPGGRPPAESRSREWTLHEGNPILSRQRPPDGLAERVRRSVLQTWNDPSVLKEGSGYLMWASLGMEGGGRNVAIYRLSSTDGIRWRVDNGSEPVLQPGRKGRGDFDWFGVETPAIVRVGALYHMYYSAYKDGKESLVTMGHAVSPDGLRWEKKGELTSLTRGVGRRAGNAWGWLARAEPTAVHRDGKFHLYFADVRCRRDDCQGSPPAVRGISLARSADGHEFRQHGSEPVILQSDPYRPEDGWEGYSTPWVLHDGRYFQMFLDAFRVIDGRHVQTALLHMRSEDGVHFETVANDIVTVADQEWCAGSVRAPTVVEDAGVLRMWFAGDNFDPSRFTYRDVMRGNPAVFLGIGYAERRGAPR